MQHSIKGPITDFFFREARVFCGSRSYGGSSPATLRIVTNQLASETKLGRPHQAAFLPLDVRSVIPACLPFPKVQEINSQVLPSSAALLP